MKQYILINMELKMSHGKIARVCHTAGLLNSNLIGFFKRIKWIRNGMTTIVLKSNLEEIRNFMVLLDAIKVKYGTHIDKGYTQVPNGSLCMLTFMMDEYKHFETIKILNELKLY